MHQTKNETLRLLVALVMAVAVGVARGEESISNQLVWLQTTYETELVKIKTDTVRKQESLALQYEKSLGVLEQGAQKAGLLDKLLAARKEKERFAAGKQVAESDYCVDHPDILKFQQDFAAVHGGLRLEQAKSIVALAEKFSGSLSRLQTRLTQDGKVEDALAVRQKAADLQKRQELSEAQFIIAERESQKPAVSAPPPEAEIAKEASKKRPGSTAKPNSKDSEKSIRKRYLEYYGALADEDLEKALRYMDPGFVRIVGPDTMKGYLTKIVPHLRSAKMAGIRFDAGRVDVDEQAGEGKNTPRYWINNNWKYSDPTYWIRLDGEWYVDCRDRKKDKPEERK